jgi:hypothetical protein
MARLRVRTWRIEPGSGNEKGSGRMDFSGSA